MGCSYQGVIWNDSDLAIEYLVSEVYAKTCKDAAVQYVSPQLETNVDNINIKSFQEKEPTQIIPKYSQCYVQVLPGRISTKRLHNIKLQKHKISVRIKVNDHHFEYLVKDQVIQQLQDMCLKIRYDFAIKNMNKEEMQFTIKNKEMIVPRINRRRSKQDIQRHKIMQQELINSLRKAQQR